MNFLAHFILSDPDPLHLIGNFAGDFIKGKQLAHLPPNMRHGVITHRAIDSYTDNHPVVKESKKLFYPIAGKYSGIIVDIVYDHFLSVNWHRYYNIPREVFIAKSQETLFTYGNLLPYRAQRLVGSLKYHRYLSIYPSYWGLQKVFSRMAKRTSLPDVSNEIISIVKANYQELDNQFNSFYPDLKLYVQTRTSEQDHEAFI